VPHDGSLTPQGRSEFLLSTKEVSGRQRHGMSSNKYIRNREQEANHNENDTASTQNDTILVKIFLVLQSVFADGNLAKTHEGQQNAEGGRNEMIDHLYLHPCAIVRIITRDV
jgi:hypothetical protein